jgi:hypothetical protein
VLLKPISGLILIPTLQHERDKNEQANQRSESCRSNDDEKFGHNRQHQKIHFVLQLDDFLIFNAQRFATTYLKDTPAFDR